jgi:hypothetical protein
MELLLEEALEALWKIVPVLKPSEKQYFLLKHLLNSEKKWGLQTLLKSDLNISQPAISKKFLQLKKKLSLSLGLINLFREGDLKSFFEVLATSWIDSPIKLLFWLLNPHSSCYCKEIKRLLFTHQDDIFNFGKHKLQKFIADKTSHADFYQGYQALILACLINQEKAKIFYKTTLNNIKNSSSYLVNMAIESLSCLMVLPKHWQEYKAKRLKFLSDEDNKIQNIERLRYTNFVIGYFQACTQKELDNIVNSDGLFELTKVNFQKLIKAIYSYNCYLSFIQLRDINALRLAIVLKVYPLDLTSLPQNIKNTFFQIVRSYSHYFKN